MSTVLVLLAVIAAVSAQDPRPLQNGTECVPQSITPSQEFGHCARIGLINLFWNFNSNNVADPTMLDQVQIEIVFEAPNDGWYALGIQDPATAAGMRMFGASVVLGCDDFDVSGAGVPGMTPFQGILPLGSRDGMDVVGSFNADGNNTAMGAITVQRGDGVCRIQYTRLAQGNARTMNQNLGDNNVMVIAAWNNGANAQTTPAAHNALPVAGMINFAMGTTISPANVVQMIQQIEPPMMTSAMDSNMTNPAPTPSTTDAPGASATVAAGLSTLLSAFAGYVLVSMW